MEEIKPGRYRHFKGNEYEVKGIANHSETLERMVVYKALYGEGGLWVRPANMWNETIERDGKTYKRFTYLDEKAEEPISHTLNLTLNVIDGEFSVCKVEDYSKVNLDDEFTFIGHTKTEKSLVCLSKDVPCNTTQREDGWRAFHIVGVLDFSLVGILAKISGVLASHQIGIFAVSTFDTDYILVKQENLEKSLFALKQVGYSIKM